MHKGPLSPLSSFPSDCRRDCRKRLAVTIETQLKVGFVFSTAGTSQTLVLWLMGFNDSLRLVFFLKIFFLDDHF